MTKYYEAYEKAKLIQLSLQIGSVWQKKTEEKQNEDYFIITKITENEIFYGSKILIEYRRIRGSYVFATTISQFLKWFRPFVEVAH